jgi:RimJ/RimL family protein N-acetyltransferase
MPEAPAEVLEVPHGRLSRNRESDAGQLAHAVGASLDHLRPWMPWATEQAADVQAQRSRCREVEAHWEDGSEYVYLLRPEQSEQVIGCFGLHRRIGPGAIEIGYWVHADFTGRGYATACARALTHAGLARWLNLRTSRGPLLVTGSLTAHIATPRGPLHGLALA